MNDVIAFLAGGIFTLSTVLATAWLIVRYYDDALTKAHSTIAELHDRLLDPEAQARFNKYMAEQKEMANAQLRQMELSFPPPQSVPDLPPEEELIVPLNGDRGFSARDLNDIT